MADYRVPIEQLEGSARVPQAEQVTEQAAPRLPETGVWPAVPGGGGPDGDGD